MGVIKSRDRLGDRHIGSALLSELSELFLSGREAIDPYRLAPNRSRPVPNETRKDFRR